MGSTPSYERLHERVPSSRNEYLKFIDEDAESFMNNLLNIVNNSTKPIHMMPEPCNVNIHVYSIYSKYYRKVIESGPIRKPKYTDGMEWIDAIVKYGRLKVTENYYSGMYLVPVKKKNYNY